MKVAMELFVHPGPCLCRSIPDCWPSCSALNLTQANPTLLIQDMSKGDCSSQAGCRCVPPSLFIFIPKKMTEISGAVQVVRLVSKIYFPY